MNKVNSIKSDLMKTIDPGLYDGMFVIKSDGGLIIEGKVISLFGSHFVKHGKSVFLKKEKDSESCITIVNCKTHKSFIIRYVGGLWKGARLS